jgi:hypothetical protein
MSAIQTRADSLREYLSGAASAGGAQTVANLSLGNYRSSTEALSYGITLTGALSGVVVQYAAGGNPPGNGVLTAPDATHLVWQPNGNPPGAPVVFSGVSDLEVVEGVNPGQYLRVSGTPPFTVGSMTVDLEYLVDNVFGLDDVIIPDALTGITEYRATILRNESAAAVFNLQRWIALLGLRQLSSTTPLPAAGAGMIVTTGSFSTWPASGWCQIQTTGGVLQELVYYTSRTNTALTVPASGRGLLGTAATAGTTMDQVFPVPGIAIGMDPAGIQSAASFIQTIANGTTPPAGVTWNLGLTNDTGLQIGSLPAGQQVGLWIKRQIPAGAKSGPLFLNKTLDSFGAF